MESADLILVNARLAPGFEPGRGAVAIGGGRILYAGPEAGLPVDGPRHDVGGRVVTPALIDCHTHLVYGGHRAAEFAMRLEGASYEEIARAGGGIVSTVRATRAATEEVLYTQALTRLDALRAEGVGTVEIKSGYGLDIETELKMLRVARRLGRETGVRVVTTFLGAHTVPETTTERVEHELREIIQSAFPGLLREAAPYMLRKLEGASFVLDHGSPDAASQAANSLIELTIRLLASHYSDAEVLEWVRQEMPNRVDELTREKDGQPVPTRKAQALCYIYAKSPAVSESLLHELAAASLTTLLARLQDVKHDDQGDASELLTVREAFIALTGALTLALRIRSAQFLDGQSTQPQRIVDLNVQQSRFV